MCGATITLGSRQATALTPVGGVAETTLAEAARSEVETWQDALEGRPQLQDEIREREAAV